MKKCIVILSGLLLMQSCQYGRPVLTENEKSDIAEAILALNDVAVQAAARVNLDAMFETLAERDHVIIRNGVLIKNKEEAYLQYQQLFQGLSKVEYHFDQLRAHILSGNAAYITACGESVVTTNDQRLFRRPFAQTTIYAREDGEWRVVHTHASSPNRS